ncbi:flagellar biosynthesis protein FlgN [Rheinheimera sp. SA_1]|jgi:flagella synthesis protein FlgN|uniref:flagella synthesis protein FlgN n=1 Tax=Rheinheimera sp. SA_1 TaxID=1827365 RepID=UPI000801FA58|nr:flagellar protein FlgN [Rheinheimera sp. SA_1]OBP15433.1 flagellar biosynthesis protein FlgN [Rheinheimera sp. SA_1]
MIEPSLILSLLNKQQEHLQVLLSLLKSELAAISSRDVERLDQGCVSKVQQLELIQQLDQQISELPQLAELKNQSWFSDAVSQLDNLLEQCKEQNEVNRQSVEQSQLVVERFKHEILQNRGKAGLTYTAKGKPAVDSIGKGIKA